MAALSGGEPEGAVGADGDTGGLVVAPTGRMQTGGEATALARGDDQPVPGGGELRSWGPDTGRPGIAEVGTEPASRGIGDDEVYLGRLTESN